MKYVVNDGEGKPHSVKVSPKDAPEKYVELPRAFAESFADVSGGFTDPVLGEVSAEEALKFFNNGFNLARRSKTVAANSIDKRIDNAVKRVKELLELMGLPATDEAVREKLKELGLE